MGSLRDSASSTPGVLLVTLRVLFVIPGDGRGNSMIFARRQAESLHALGVQVRTFFLRSRTSVAELAREFRRFRGELRQDRPDIVHAHFGTMTAMFAAGAAGSVPLVITYRGGDLNPSPEAHNLRSATGRVMSQLAALRAARIVCVSSQLRDRLWWKRGVATVLATGADLEIFRPEPRDTARERLGWPRAGRVVLFNAGRDPRIKRVDLAQAAMAVARRAIPDLRCEILDGNVPPALIPAYMNAADCLLLTSDHEGSPAVIQEALACDLPIVSVDAGDAVERLRGVRHTRIVPRDAEALGAALAEIAGNPRRTDGHLKAAEFSATEIAARLIELYRSIGNA